MATGTAAVAARELKIQAAHYLRMTVNYSDTGISTGRPFANYLPSGAVIEEVIVRIVTAFNAATTNVLTVGQNSSSYNDMVAAGDVDETTAGTTKVLRGADLTISSDALPYVKYTQTGTAATAGQAIIIIKYIPNNDL